MNKEDYIRHLLEKYLDGETSTNEENALRGYFSKAGNSIPDEWRPYKAMFAYIAEEKGKTLNAGAGRMKKTHASLIYIASAAASVLIIISVILSSPRQAENYAVINGKVCTDKEVVREEALEALQMVSADDDDTFGALDMMRH